MKYWLLLLLISNFVTSFAQKRRRQIIFNDTYSLNEDSTLRNHGIKKELIYLCNKKDHNKDSFLIFVNYFDSLGKLQEIDGFREGRTDPDKVINYYYEDSLLKTIQKFSLNYDEGIDTTITTLLYDAHKNKISETIYYYNRTPLYEPNTQTVSKYEYNANNQLTSYYQTADNRLYLRNKYTYNSAGNIEEIQFFMPNGSLGYSFVYEHDFGETTVYQLTNGVKNLESTSWYNTDSQLTKLSNANETHVYTRQYINQLISVEMNVYVATRRYIKHYYF